MKTILFATDLGASSHNALNWARMLTNHYQATLRLIYVHAPNSAIPVVPGIGAPAVLDTRTFDNDELNREQLTELASQLKSEGISVQTDYRVGNVDDEIRAVVKKTNADLLITGRSLMDSFFDRFLGSTATDIATGGVACPVLVVPASETDQPVQFRKAVYATQLEGKDNPILRPVLEFVRSVGASLELIHVEAGNQPDLFSDEEAIRELQNEFGKDTISVKKVEARTVSDGLTNYLDRHPTDLLIMTTRERGFLDGLLNPSLTGRMLKEVSVPVLVYHI